MLKYLSKLTDSQIIGFFRKLGISPYLNINNKDKIIGPFIRGENALIYRGVMPLSEKQKEQTEIEQLIYDKITELSPTIKMFTSRPSTKDELIVLIHMNDFCVYVMDNGEKLTSTDVNLNDAYITHMAKYFGKEYVEDYKEYVNSHTSDKTM